MANYPTLGKYANMQIAGKELLIDNQLFVGKNVKGKDIFVDSVNGNAANNGLSPAKAVLTTTAATALTTANQGDRVFWLPGHTETFAAAAGTVLSTAGVSYIGLGEGMKRPIFNLGTLTSTTITVTAANVKVQNAIFLSTFADVVTIFDVTAVGFTLRDCLIGDSAVDLNVKSAVKCTGADNTADDITLINNRFLSQDAATLAFVIFAGDVFRPVIEDNLIVNEGTGLCPIFNCLTGKDFRMGSCQRNKISTKASANQLGYFNDTVSPNNSGIIADNYIGHADTSGQMSLGVVGGCRMFNNLTVSTDALSGFVIPAIDVDL